MIYLQLSGVTKAFREEKILKGIDIQVVRGDKYGLIGPNGSGKTTILKIVLGQLLPDTGTVTLSNQIRLGYVSQEDELDSHYPLFLAMLESYSELLAIKSEMEELEGILASGEARSLTRYGELQHRWEVEGGYTLDVEIKTTLIGLGFSEDDFHRPLSTFSGGERNRAQLARVLLRKPDLLLLDEPTNHLDIESTIWLEEYLRRFEGALIIVSHDRLFLDNVVNKVVELSEGVLELYHGNFTQYCEERAERRRLQLKKYLEQQQEIVRIEDFIARNIAGQKTKQAQSRRHALTKLERLKAPAPGSKSASIRMQASRRSYQLILRVEDLSLAFDRRVLLTDASFEIERGDKVALIGRNGSGKTTLIRAIVGDLAVTDGAIELGRNVDLEYFDQELAMLEPNETVIDTVWNLHPEWDAFTLRSYLARFLFFGEDVFKQVKMLSGGERKKLALAWLLALPANFIILDEPTNHLDLGSREALEEALRGFDGTVLVVSHDRYFINSIATRILALEQGHLIDWRGSYTSFAERETQPNDSFVDTERAKKRLSHREERRLKNVVTSRKRRIKELEDKIAQLEQRIEQVQGKQHDESIANDWEKLSALGAEEKLTQQQLEATMWEYYSLREEDETPGS